MWLSQFFIRIWIHVQFCLHVFIALPLLLPAIASVFVYVFYPFLLLISWTFVSGRENSVFTYFSFEKGQPLFPLWPPSCWSKFHIPYILASILVPRVLMNENEWFWGQENFLWSYRVTWHFETFLVRERRRLCQLRFPQNAYLNKLDSLWHFSRFVLFWDVGHGTDFFKSRLRYTISNKKRIWLSYSSWFS